MRRLAEIHERNQQIMKNISAAEDSRQELDLPVEPPGC